MLDLQANASSVHLYAAMAKDNEPPSSQNTIPAQHSWFGLGIRVYEGNPSYFCRGCEYKVLISSQQETAYILHFQTSKSVTKIKGSQFHTYEIAHSGERNCYEYNVNDAKSTLEVFLNTFSGDPDIYVNPQNLPSEKASFAFASKGTLDEALSVTPEQRERLNAATGKYFICIYGSYTSSYGLVISSTKDGENEKFAMQSGLTRTMQVGKDQLVLFEYMTSTHDEGNITFTLTSITGNADLYIKYCSVPLGEFGNPLAPCELTKGNMLDPAVKKSQETGSADIITLEFKSDQCGTDRVRCSFLVGVYGKEESQFSLTIIGDSRTETPIAEGKPFIGYVPLHQAAYFTFFVSDPEVTAVKIQLTSLSGDADIFVTRHHQAEERLKSERYSNHGAFLPDSILYEKPQDGTLNASYHVIVYGHSFATFTLTYTTKRGDRAAAPVQLVDGVPTSSTINGTADQTGVRFYIQQRHTRGVAPDLNLEITGIVGSFIVYVGAGYNPEPNNYTWIIGEQERNLLIPATDPSYRHGGRYNILVTKAHPESSVPHLFTIKYSTGKFTTSIKEGQPELGNMTRGEMRYYKYQVVNTEGSVMIAVTPFLGDPDLYISINSSNPRPSQENYDYVGAAIGPDAIRIPLKDFYKVNPGCSIRSFISFSCAIYIGVRCASDECAYSLQAGRSTELVLKLLDGVPQFGSAFAGEPQFYMFSPSSAQDATVITVYPKKGRAKVYVNVVGPEVDAPAMPKPESHQAVSINRANTEVLVVRSDTLQACRNQCRVYIGVYVDLASSMPGANETLEFNIAATSQIRQISDGQTIVDQVGDKMYKYYRFRAGCTDCVLSISVTPLSSGDPDLFVNKAFMRLPTSEQHDFSALAYRGDFLQITSEEVAAKVPRWPQLRGPYVIGVYGSQNCTYSLVVSTSASKFQDITQGVPIKKDQPKNKISYFFFYSWKKQDIRIRLTMYSGRATIRANVVNSLREANVLESLPSTEAKSKWSSLENNTVNSLVISKSDPQHKEDGVYFIGVETQEDSMYDITVEYVSSQDFSLIKMAEAYRVRLNTSEVMRYSFEVASKGAINIHINTFFGAVEGDVSTEKTGDPMWRINSLTGLIIRDTDRNFKTGTYYITLRGKVDSDITIMVEQNMKIIWLSEGLPQRAEVGPQSLTYFFYRIPRSNQKNAQIRFNVYATMRTENIVNPEMYIRFITRQDSNYPNALNADYIARWDKDLGRLGMSLTINSTNSSTLAIAVKADLLDGSGPKGEFDIVAWTAGFALIIPENVYMNSFQKLGDTHFYELPLNKTGKVYIEVMPCTGEVEFRVASSLSGMEDRKYDLKKTELSRGKLFGSLENASGTYYISVRAVAFSGMAKDIGKGILYSIRAIVSSEETAENLEDFVPAAYGNIESYIEGEELTLSWGHVSQRGALTKKLTRVVYSLYVSEDDKANMYTICGIKDGDTERIATEISAQTFTYSLKEKHKHDAKKLTFNVIAYIPDYGETIAYNPLSIQMSKPRGVGISRFYIVMMVVLVLVLGAAACYFWRKYKKAMQQLEYEMNDVRNIGHISTSRDVPENKAETYTHLRVGSED